MTKLHDSLHCNPSLDELFLDPPFFSWFDHSVSLPDAIHKSPAQGSLDFRRSVSLPDFKQSSDDALRHSRSCTELHLLHSLQHNIHPLLYKVLRCHPGLSRSLNPHDPCRHQKLYHNKDCLLCYLSELISFDDDYLDDSMAAIY